MTHCKLCQTSLSGRSDKRFCSSLCRSEYHNRRSREQNRALEKIEGILRKNRKVLHHCFVEMGQNKVHRVQLLRSGFDFPFVTALRKSGGTTLFFCYDLYYVPLENNYFALGRCDPLNAIDEGDI